MTHETELSTLSLALLGLLAQQPRSGYDLRKFFATTPMGHFSRSPGAIYPALRRLEKEGWIQGAIDNARTLRPRQVFRLTTDGRRRLKKFLARPVTRADLIWRADQILLRFGFLGELLGRQAAIRFLTRFAQEVESYLVELRGLLESMRDTMSVYGRLALESGIEDYEMTARWARRAIKELEKK